MKALYLENTEDSPKILFNSDTGVLHMEGRSYMEDANPFNKEIIKWLRSYFQNPQKKTVLDLQLDYVNTASTKMLINILFELNKFYIFGNEVVVKWGYVPHDEDMEDMGHELQEMVELPFEFYALA